MSIELRDCSNYNYISTNMINELYKNASVILLKNHLHILNDLFIVILLPHSIYHSAIGIYQ